MSKTLIAQASTTIAAPAEAVWEALTNPDSIERYMFGAKVTTSWAEDTPIYWKGEYKGVAYEDKGIVLDFDPPNCLEFSHYSPLSGLPDIPTSYHTVMIKLEPRGKQTHVSLTQDNNADEKAKAHSQKNWEMMLGGLKTFVEEQSTAAQGPPRAHDARREGNIKTGPAGLPPH